MTIPAGEQTMTSRRRQIAERSASTLRRGFHRGITVMEVLVSMVVALIGVLGIMILIPFSVNQVQTAFNYETAHRLGHNAANEWKIKGFNNSNRWIAMTPAPNSVAGRTVRAYMVDPLGVDARTNSPSPHSGFFPFVNPALTNFIWARTGTLPSYTDSDPSADKCILIERVNLASTIGPVMTTDLARRHFTWSHDLQLQSPTRADVVGFESQYPSVDLAPPQQIYDINSANQIMRRQALGDVSYVVVTVPADVTPAAHLAGYPLTTDSPARFPDIGNEDRVFGFRNFVLVYKQRPLPVDPLNLGGLAPYDRVYEVAHPLDGHATPATAASLRVGVSGGVVVLQENALVAPSNNESTQRREIRAGDWMALTNVTFDGNRRRFVQNIDFYVVLDAVENGAIWTVTLQGPDFDFQLARLQNGAFTNRNPATFDRFCAQVVDSVPEEYIPSRTCAIHLPDVWAVVERSDQ